MRIICNEGRYVHPQFTLETEEVSPDLPEDEAKRIIKDFPKGKFSEATDKEYEDWLKKTKKTNAAEDEEAQERVDEATMKQLKESEDSTRAEMIKALREAGYTQKQIDKLVKEKEKEITEPTNRLAPESTVERSTKKKDKKNEKKDS